MYWKKSHRRTVPRASIFLAIASLLGLVGVFFFASSTSAAPGINEQVSYQARLLNNNGAVVLDGVYNMEFKIYQDGGGCIGGGSAPCGGDLQWTETRTNGNRVTVTNGYFSVQLGSVTAFGNDVDWNQDTLWLSINIGGTGGTPSWDGEMTPFRRLTASPYALNAGKLGGLDWSQFVQLAPGAVQVDSSALSSIAINKTGTGNILHLQNNSDDVMVVNGTGVGINLSNPDGALDVYGGGTFRSRVEIGPLEFSQGFEGVTFPPGSPGTWSTGGNANWARTTSQSQEGAASAQAGTITHDQASYLDWEVTVDDDSILSFYWKVSSESGFDHLGFCVNDTTSAGCQNPGISYVGLRSEISGEVDWTEVQVTIPAGTNTIRWIYGKDGSVTGGQDTGWIDNVRINSGIVDQGLRVFGPDDVQLFNVDSVSQSITLDTRNIDISAEDELSLGAWSGTAYLFGGSEVNISSSLVTMQGGSFTMPSTGLATFKTSSNNTAAFQILNAASVPLFVANTSQSRIHIGNPTADATGALLVLDTKNTAGDPAGVNGSMYYNSNSGQNRCYEGDVWRDCDMNGRVVAQLRRAAGQSIPNNTSTAISWDTQEYLPFGGHSTSVNPIRFTPTVPGRYTIYAKAGFATNANGRRAIQITKNGTIIDGSFRSIAASPTGTGGVDVSLTIPMNGTTDYITVLALQVSGGALDLTPDGPASSTFIATYAGP